MMNRWAMCLTPAAAAAPSAARPGLVWARRMAACGDGGRSSTSPRKPVRWRARSSSDRHAGTTSTKRNSAALSSASEEARSIALSSSAFSGLRWLGIAAASLAPISCSSASRACASTMADTVRRLARVSLVSVVAPMHDEAATVAAFHERVSRALEGRDWELVVVDDGSRDGTYEARAAIAAEDERLRIVRLSRSFGHQAALTAGLEHARGDA